MVLYPQVKRMALLNVEENVWVNMDYLVLVITTSVLGVHWKGWCWCWRSSPLATSCEELTHWKRPWCWERLKAGGEGDNRGWDGWMVSLTRWTWVWVNSRSWWWTGRPGVLRFMGSQRAGQDWATELNWIDPVYGWCFRFTYMFTNVFVHNFFSIL